MLSACREGIRPRSACTPSHAAHSSSGSATQSSFGIAVVVAFGLDGP
jgi:hypothetical protein